MENHAGMGTISLVGTSYLFSIALLSAYLMANTSKFNGRLALGTLFGVGFGVIPTYCFYWHSSTAKQYNYSH